MSCTNQQPPRNGNLVEWKTNYAYGADESGWKSLDAQYDNAEEPYGFTGKEEDDEVGLHDFGARYYSSYLARWLGPDPPVVHGGGMSNHFGYGANSPYIYVDPDGNNPIGAIIGAVIGAIVGGISGGVQAAKNGESVFGGVIWGAYKGASIGAAAGGGGPWAAAGAATAFNQAEMAYRRGGGSRRLMMTFGLVGAAISGGDIGMTQGFAVIGAVVGNATSPEFHKASAITFGTSVVSGYVGAGINAGISSPAGSAIAGWGGSLAVTYASAGITGTLNRENADDLFLSSSASYWGSYAGSAVGGEIANVGVRRSLGDDEQGTNTGESQWEKRKLTWKERRIANAARRTAIKQISRTIKAIDRALDPENVDTDGTSEVIEAAQRYFGGQVGDEELTQLRSNLVRTMMKLRSLGRNGFVFDTDPDTIAAVDSRDQNHIILGQRFFTSSESNQWQAIVHEGTHFIDAINTEDYYYGYPDCVFLGSVDPESAKKNADSYRYFVRDVSK